MSRRIAQIINEPEREVASLIKDLESKNGYPSHDARHLAENAQKIRLKILDLGLDPHDTTAQELYHALNVKFSADSHRFESDHGVNSNDFEQISTTAVKLINSYIDLPSHWALKTKTAKQILRANPPKKLMKYLGYRSVESLLKRENVFEAYIATHYFESKQWHKSIEKQVSKLNQTDFETRQVKLVVLSDKKWPADDPANELGFYDNIVAAAGLWPAQILSDTPLLTMVLMLLDSFNPNVHFKHGAQLAKMNLVLWWADMDHVVSELSGEHVSLNLKDCALNTWYQNSFDQRILDNGRKSFWQELVNRYQNRPADEPAILEDVKQKVDNLRLAVPEPALEFVEEFDG